MHIQVPCCLNIEYELNALVFHPFLHLCFELEWEKRINWEAVLYSSIYPTVENSCRELFSGITMVENCLVVFKCLWLDCNDLQRYQHTHIEWKQFRTHNSNRCCNTLCIRVIWSFLVVIFVCISNGICQPTSTGNHRQKQLKIYAFCPNKSG